MGKVEQVKELRFTRVFIYLFYIYIYIFFFFFFFFSCPGSPLACGLSQVADVNRCHSLLVVHRFLTVVASLVVELKGTQAQELWHMGLVSPWHVASSQTRDQT